MKKIFILAALAMVSLSSSADRLYKSSRFFDNWSLGVSGGVQSNLYKWNTPQGAVAGLHLDKEVSPVFGLTFESYVNVNGVTNWMYPTQMHIHGAYNNIIDGVSAFAVGRVNLCNLFGGYAGHRRVFEIEALAGAGYGHTFTAGSLLAPDDALMAKAGLNLNFNLGKLRAWTLSLRPAAVWAATSKYSFDGRYAVGELTAGLTYHFKNSNGTHSFAFGRPYDEGEVNALNAKINDLRGVVTAKDSELADAQRTIRDLQQALNDCRNQQPVVRTETKTVTKTVTEFKNLPDVLVTFRQGKCVVDASQFPNVERVATYLKNHANARVVVRGYASPEGSADINAKIARTRAEAVQKVLTEKYGIATSRITAEGQGVGDMFSEPDWNRVSICTIEE